MMCEIFWFQLSVLFCKDLVQFHGCQCFCGPCKFIIVILLVFDGINKTDLGGAIGFQ